MKSFNVLKSFIRNNTSTADEKQVQSAKKHFNRLVNMYCRLAGGGTKTPFDEAHTLLLLNDIVNQLKLLHKWQWDKTLQAKYAVGIPGPWWKATADVLGNYYSKYSTSSMYKRLLLEQYKTYPRRLIALSIEEYFMDVKKDKAVETFISNLEKDFDCKFNYMCVICAFTLYDVSDDGWICSDRKQQKVLENKLKALYDKMDSNEKFFMSKPSDGEIDKMMGTDEAKDFKQRVQRFTQKHLNQRKKRLLFNESLLNKHLDVKIDMLEEELEKLKAPPEKNMGIMMQGIVNNPMTQMLRSKFKTLPSPVPLILKKVRDYCQTVNATTIFVAPLNSMIHNLLASGFRVVVTPTSAYAGHYQYPYDTQLAFNDKVQKTFSAKVTSLVLDQRFHENKRKLKQGKTFEEKVRLLES